MPSSVTKSATNEKEQKLNSPTFTDSTDEPTPMGLFKQGKGFKFNVGMDNEMQEGIGFDDSNVTHNNRTKSNNDKVSEGSRTSKE